MGRRGITGSDGGEDREDPGDGGGDREGTGEEGGESGDKGEEGIGDVGENGVESTTVGREVGIWGTEGGVSGKVRKEISSERLDRCLVNAEWCGIFPNTNVLTM